MTHNFGLTPDDEKQMHNVFAMHPHLSKVILFGSRAKSTHKTGSDVDLAIICNNNSFRTVNRIKLALEEDTTLPYFFDVIDYESIESETMKKHIRQYGKVLYKK